MSWENWRLGRVGERDPIRHYNKGTGDLKLVAVANTVVSVAASDSVVVTARDIITTIQGGVAKPAYTFFLARASDSYASGSSIAENEYLSFDASDSGVVACKIAISDGTNTSSDVSVAVTVQAIGGP